MNIDLLKYDTHTKTNDYLESIFSFVFSPVITLPTRLASSSATIIPGWRRRNKDEFIAKANQDKLFVLSLSLSLSLSRAF